ncbi:cytochrome P450 2M1-like [Watersipora subatra]|uniref:cytochrome P450 2M1-like n=1 Tax=Watersipora subatra TaxID=2589382 RepID=UPI00355BAE3D
MSQVLIAAAGLLLVYLLVKWLKDPIRKIPGPPGLPLLGNVLSMELLNLHNQFYEMARKYGAVMKVKIFSKPVVILNSREACLEALTKTGTDFQGRPHLPRMLMITAKDPASMTLCEQQVKLRRLFTKAMSAFGPGIRHLEDIMQETILDMIEDIDRNDGEAIDTERLCVGYVCCIIASMVFGEKHSYDDDVCQEISKMNTLAIKASDPLSSGAVFDIFPFLLRFRFLFPEFCHDVDAAQSLVDELVKVKVQQAKESFDAQQKRGCLDYFIEVQQKQEVDKDGRPLLDDEEMKGMVFAFIAAGLETSRRSLAQIFLDLLRDPVLQKALQAEIDSQFETTHFITLKDKYVVMQTYQRLAQQTLPSSVVLPNRSFVRQLCLPSCLVMPDKLPQLEAYMLEHFRYLTQAPFLFPHMTIRETQVAGFKIPANTTVLINSYYAAHNPDVYDDPFTVQPKRFLDKNGQLVDREHPLRQNFFGFGAGRRACPGEHLARSRIFLFLANILQKYDLELQDELPEDDVRKYPLSILLTPPSVKVRFIRRC